MVAVFVLDMVVEVVAMGTVIVVFVVNTVYDGGGPGGSVVFAVVTFFPAGGCANSRRSGRDGQSFLYGCGVTVVTLGGVVVAALVV